MDRGAWRATVHGVAESDMTEQLTVIWDQHPTFSHPPVHREWQELYHRQDSQDPGLPGGAGGREPACQYRRHKRRGSNPCVGKTPWRRAWHPTPVFLPGESHGQRSLATVHGVAKSRTRLGNFTFTFNVILTVRLFCKLISQTLRSKVSLFPHQVQKLNGCLK